MLFTSSRAIVSSTTPIPARMGRKAAGETSPAAFACGALMRTIVYVDGFNLYYGALRGSPYRWLDIAALCDRLLPRNDVLIIKYFAARVRGRPNDPNKPRRQQALFAAWEAQRRVQVVLGQFRSHAAWMPRWTPDGPGAPTRVIRTEEKGSDVNLAVHMVRDGFEGRFDVAVLISNDSDLKEAIRTVRDHLALDVGVINPQRGRMSAEPSRHASFTRTLRRGVIRASQMPDVVSAEGRKIYKPRTW